MNQDRIEGRWTQIKGKLKERWGQLTDDNLDRLEGQWDQLAGLIQRQYGVARDEVERQLDDYKREYERQGQSAVR